MACLLQKSTPTLYSPAFANVNFAFNNIDTLKKLKTADTLFHSYLRYSNIICESVNKFKR